MIIKQTMVNITYPMVIDCRKKFINNESILNEYFQPANILSVPDQINPEIPRMFITTKNNHSLLNLSLIGATLTTNIDGDFTDDWSHCKNYLDSRMKVVYQLIDELTNKNEKYTGLVTKLEYVPVNDSAESIIKKFILRDNGDKLGNPYNVSCKLTYIFDKKYYINVSLENKREYKSEKTDLGNIILRETGNSSLGITLDINDRYLSNNKKDYKTSKDVFADLLNITSEFVTERLEAFVATGELRYGR
ncbi:hypothetical protein B0O40_0679 [Ruminococcaceae bacterium R-25]|nr:hypothetical protein B0O40_0679 [Ruminococcaceae bacterium R-25]SUQ11308.1 hypothetical protein SAMN06297423_0679 [Oscillospiraceae bacterium]